MGKKLPHLEASQKHTEKWVNHNEQNSRRNNIRLRGLAVSREEPCIQTVVKFLNNQLNLKDPEGNHVQVKVSDIDAAHPLPSRRMHPQM